MPTKVVTPRGAVTKFPTSDKKSSHSKKHSQSSSTQMIRQLIDSQATSQEPRSIETYMYKSQVHNSRASMMSNENSGHHTRFSIMVE